jgi:hypothetical protein
MKEHEHAAKDKPEAKPAHDEVAKKAYATGYNVVTTLSPRDSLTVRGRDGAAPPISLCVDGKACGFVSGTTRVFRLND